MKDNVKKIIKRNGDPKYLAFSALENRSFKVGVNTISDKSTATAGCLMLNKELMYFTMIPINKIPTGKDKRYRMM
jgi:hypothetical protein